MTEHVFAILVFFTYEVTSHSLCFHALIMLFIFTATFPFIFSYKKRLLPHEGNKASHVATCFRRFCLLL